VIGTVGSTGLSTGPHLHYGLQQRGRYLNPLRLQSPSTAPLPGEMLAEFQKHCARVLAPLAGPARARALAVSMPQPASGLPAVVPGRSLDRR
jgi:murein DD-endopeptidase MepM/ murein hydrolase activator NlpD